MNRVLLIEDDKIVAESLKGALEVEGYEVLTATNAAEGLALIRDGNSQAVVTDINLCSPEASGMDILKTLHATRPLLPVILITGEHTTDVAIEAMKFGAYDYVVKSGQLTEELIGVLGRAFADSQLTAQPVEMGESGSSRDAIIGSSRVMRDVYKEIGRVAAMPVTVLIRGETGTGKELVARATFQHSDRAKQPFVEVNCVAIPENLLESEMFGHEAGAFTDAKARRIGRFEQANRGTIFLDEIGDMRPSTQAKLLRVLQNRMIQRVGGKEPIPVDVRVLAATHRNLESAIQEGGFRQDLYHRLTEAVITLPPLRDRREDIPELVRFFIHRHASQLGSSAASMPTPEAMALFHEHPWPGNVRELRNVIRKSLLLARGYPISREIVTLALAQTQLPKPSGDESIAGYVSDLLARAKAGELENVQVVLTEAIERELYGQAIRMANGDQSKAGSWLGVSRPTMREKLLKYGLHPSQTQPGAWFPKL
jgi:DNA-binding NtrC family response regulator